MRFIDVQEILKNVKYKNWKVEAVHAEIVDGFDGDVMGYSHIYLQVTFLAADSVTGKVTTQYGRKWLISEHMTKSEVVLTALKAVLTAEEHEAREEFKYKGFAIFHPHLDVDALVDSLALGEIPADVRS